MHAVANFSLFTIHFSLSLKYITNKVDTAQHIAVSIHAF